jgi:hypothetical protein
MAMTAAWTGSVRRGVWRATRAVVGVAWPTPRRFVFILSHMRSGSSLLTHILTNNAEVFGYGECHVPHTSLKGLREVSFKTAVRLRTFPPRDEWLLDKILHNSLPIDDGLLQSRAGRFVFLLRAPEATLRSLLSLRRWVKDSSIRNPQQALTYYLARLAHLRQLASAIPAERALLVHYEDLLQQTDGVLRSLERHLDLSSPLTEEYDVTRTTGRKSIGDPSPVIRSGSIRRDLSSAEVDLPEDVLQAAIAGYRETRAALEASHAVAGNS